MERNALLVLMLVCYIHERHHSRQRRSSLVRYDRIDLAAHIERYRQCAELVRALRFPIDSFELLCSVLKDSLKRDELQANRRGGYVTPDMCVFSMLRWLAGGEYLDVMFHVGISRDTFYRIVWLTIDAVIASTDPLLDNIHFPNSPAELLKAAKGFESISQHRAIRNCVSVIDGLLVKIQTPPKKRKGRPGGVDNVQSFFSGHYKRYGFNVQAAVDHKCRFQFIGVAGPGVMSDREAVQKCRLLEKILAVPLPYVTIGDAGYTAFDPLATIFTSYHTQNPKYDNFNFFASQLRIRVEMAFGMLTTKWQRLQKPLQIAPERWWKLIVALARLHNFRINQRETQYTTVDRAEAIQRVVPSHPHRSDGTPVADPQDNYLPYDPGTSSRREVMALEIESRNLTRPRAALRPSD